MDRITLQYQNKTLSINKRQAEKIELRINLMLNKNYWLKLGDILYNFHALNKVPRTPIQNKEDQINILQEILTT